jgi:trimeric autotransporter adhesin
MLMHYKNAIVGKEAIPGQASKLKVKGYLFLFFYFSFFLNCSAQIISTISGNGYKTGRSRGGYSGDGGPAIAAELYCPPDIVFDRVGNMYIADGNSCVRRVDAYTGIITTIAGNGKLGLSGDGGQATNAELSYPTGLALDAAGNIYIADIFNNEIREVNIATGIITAVAGNGYNALSNYGGYSGDGGPARSAELNAPEGIAFDSYSNLYIADCNNNVIRKVSASTGIISTVAGNSLKGFGGDGGQAVNAKLSGPGGVTVDYSGNIYIADRENNVIRKVNAFTGVITTIAGNNAVAGYTGDGGPATIATLNSPRNIAFDPSGNMYIADFYNNAIRKVSSATGIITTLCPPAAPGVASVFLQPACAISDASGNIFVADEGNNVIRKVSMSIEQPGNDMAFVQGAAGNVVYEVQLMATRNKLKGGITIAGTDEKATENKENGLYKYATGNFSNHADAVKYMNQMRAMGYADAFVKTIKTDVAQTQGMVFNASSIR